jgi:hypothetical protein
MPRTPLRIAVAFAVLAALLLPAASPAQETTFLARLRDLFLAFTASAVSDNGSQIDPEGAAGTACDNRSQIDPDGRSSCTANDNGWQIDPNG